MKRCIRLGFLVLALLTVVFAGQAQAQNTITYVYDKLGRLVGVVDPAGDTAVYTYDAVGNLLSISRYSSSQVSIISFTPDSGPIGAEVAIYGTGFSTTASENTVKFNGITATVTSSTFTEIVATVPAGATTGPINVTTSAGSATSSANFTVTSNPAPTVSSFSPAIGTAGTAVSIQGTNFELVPSRNKVKIGVPFAVVDTATATTIGTSVPVNTGSGRVSVATPAGTGVSSGYFFIPPSPYTAADVAFTGQTQLDSSNTATVGTANKIALVVFDGAATQRVSIHLTNVTIANQWLSLNNPDGTNNFSFHNGVWFEPKSLPTAGVYTIVIDPDSTYTGSATINLYNVPPDVSQTIGIGGSPVTVTTTVPGQNANLTFTGTGGQQVSLVMTDTTYPGSSGSLGTVAFLNPDGTTLAGPYVYNAQEGLVDNKTLPANGTYKILVDPSYIYTGNTTLTLYESSDVIGAITPGGPPVTVSTTVPGQNARLSFSGTAGQRVSLKIENVVVSGGSTNTANIAIVKPDGVTLTSDTVTPPTAKFIDTQTLPVTGTYEVRVNPASTSTSSMTLTLYDVPPDAGGAIAIGGTPVTVTITTPGQNAALTFEGTAGQLISLLADSVTVSTNSSGLIRKPDGTTLASFIVYSTTGAFLDTQTLPVTGTYTITLNPNPAFPGHISGAATGSIRMTLYDTGEIVGTIAPGGPSVTLNFTSPGQNARLPFDGIAGQQVSMKVDNNTLSPSNGYATVSLLKPDGVSLASFAAYPGFVAFWDAVTLPVTGTYTIRVDPSGTQTGSLRVTLYDATEVTGTIEPGGPPVTVSLPSPGQNARLSFTGAANQMVSLQMTSVTISSSAVRLLKPDGTTLATVSVGTSGAFMDTQTLPVAGTYSIVVDPSSMNTGSMTLTLYNTPDITGSITPGGSPVTVNIGVPGQNARLTFTGTANQLVSLQMTSVTIPGTTVSILKPDGTSLASLWVTTSGGFIDTKTLPVSGTYTILVNPSSTNTGNMTLTLYDTAEITGTITVGGPAVPVSIGIPGQNARLTFSGTASQQITMRVTSNTMGSVTLKLLRPDGTTQTTTTSSSTSFNSQTVTLATTGTYTITIDPSTTNTGSLNLAVTNP